MLWVAEPTLCDNNGRQASSDDLEVSPVTLTDGHKQSIPSFVEEPTSLRPFKDNPGKTLLKACPTGTDVSHCF